MKYRSWWYSGIAAVLCICIAACSKEKQDTGPSEFTGVVGNVFTRAGFSAEGNKLKGEWDVNGEVYACDKDSNDGEPSHAKIGDGQCHHFVAAVPPGSKNVRVRLEYPGDYDIRILLKKDSFAFDGASDYEEKSARVPKFTMRETACALIADRPNSSMASLIK